MTNFSKSNLSTFWLRPFGDVKLDITTPDFSKLDSEVEGDWGSEYTFTLDPKDLFKIVYTANGEKFESHIESKTIKVKSPISHAERKVRPFYTVIKDLKHNLQIKMYFSQEGQLTEAKCFALS